MIDLHTHTNESDGTLTPAELIEAARDLQLEALAITDHDTFAGYDRAAPHAQASGFDLVCGLELSSRMTGPRHAVVHLLGYFLNAPPGASLRGWLQEVLADRRERNVRLIEKLKSQGVDIELSEVEAAGRTLTARPHFARILVKKRYATDSEDAFRKYLAETAPGYVERKAPDAQFAIAKIVEAGGLAVAAHPVRLGFRDAAIEEAALRELRDAGLGGIEAYHSDHRPEDVSRYLGIARKLNLAITGGSDFHGDAKPAIRLGTGRNGNVHVPRSVLDDLRRPRQTSA